MASDAQIKASRRNGSFSKGPVTPEGKARSSANATKHGMHSRSVVLSNESPDRYEELRSRYVAELRPETPVEEDLVLTVVNATWRLNRVVSIETASIDLEMDRQRAEILEKFARIDEPTRTAIAWSSLAAGPSSLTLVGRSESRLRRTLERALDRLERLQDKRKSKMCENEPGV